MLTSLRGTRRPAAAATLALLALVACDRSADSPARDSAAPAATAASASTPAPPDLAVLPSGALRQLRWIEGSWRGSGDGQPPFYERYRFGDDSTLLVDSFDDSTMAKVAETSHFELRGGTLANASDGPRWGAVRLDSSSVTFAPITKARNSFTWRRDSADVWTALLEWPASSPGGARQRTYHMVRIRR